MCYNKTLTPSHTVLQTLSLYSQHHRQALPESWLCLGHRKPAHTLLKVESAYHLCGWDVRPAGRNLPGGVQLKKPYSMHHKLQQVYPQDDAMQVEWLCTVVSPPDVRCDWECLVIITPQCLHNLPDLQLQLPEERCSTMTSRLQHSATASFAEAGRLHKMRTEIDWMQGNYCWNHWNLSK